LHLAIAIAGERSNPLPATALGQRRAAFKKPNWESTGGIRHRPILTRRAALCHGLPRGDEAVEQVAEREADDDADEDLDH
jgi:hypothetical protein